MELLRLALAAIIIAEVIAFSGFRSNLSIRSNRLSASMALSQDELKKMVGYKAVDDYVRSGMSVGLGTGSTAFFAVERIGQKIKSGELKDVVCVPSSERTKEQAMKLGIPLVTLNEMSKLDVSIDGADDVDPDLNLVKGAGGSLLRDKMVYLPVVSEKFICIVDESKLSKGLGPGAPLPVEIATFCCEHTRRLIESLPSVKGCKAVLRMGDVSNTKADGAEIAVTDNGNYIVDLFFTAPLADAALAAKELLNTAGVLEHGIFTGMTYALIVAGKDGVRVAGTGGEKPWW
jgi:ribose 5-phosphate isomerase A